MSEGEKNRMTDSRLEWMRMGSLLFDYMLIKNKVKFDPHTHELVGFNEGALKKDVLMKELESLDDQQSTSGSSKTLVRPELSQQFLIFIFSSWDADCS